MFTRRRNHLRRTSQNVSLLLSDARLYLGLSGIFMKYGVRVVPKGHNATMNFMEIGLV